MVEQILRSISRSMSQVGQETGQFRKAAADQNKSIGSFIKDVSKMFSSQNKQQASINSSLDDIQYNSQQTNSKVSQSNDLIQESISIQTQMLSELRSVAKGIGSLIEGLGLGGPGENLGSKIATAVAAGGIGLAGGALFGAGAKFLSDQSGTDITNFIGSGGNANSGAGSSENAKIAFDFFKSKGWSDEHSAGIVGNLQAESGKNLNPSSVGDGGKAYGIAQWHPDRQQNFEKTYGKPIQQSTFQEQLEFIDWELQNTEQKAAQIIKQAKTASEAAAMVDKYYERSAGIHLQQRMNNAEALMPKKDNSKTNVEASADTPTPVNKSNVTNNMGALSSRGTLQNKKGFIIHHTGGRGSVEGVVNTLNQRNLSVQYVIDREGKIHQLMPSGSRASHMRKGQGIGAGLSNDNTEGVEIIAKDDSDVLPIQVEAAKRLAQQLGYSPDQVYGHGEVNPHKQKTEGSTVVNAIRGGTPRVKSAASDTYNNSDLGGMAGAMMGQTGNAGYDQYISQLGGMGAYGSAAAMLTGAGASMLGGMTGISLDNLLNLFSGSGGESEASANEPVTSEEGSQNIEGDGDVMKVAKLTPQPSLVDNRAMMIEQNASQTQIASQMPYVPVSDKTQHGDTQGPTGYTTHAGNMSLNGLKDTTLPDWYRSLFGVGGGRIVPDNDFYKTLA